MLRSQMEKMINSLGNISPEMRELMSAAADASCGAATVTMPCDVCLKSCTGVPAIYLTQVYVCDSCRKKLAPAAKKMVAAAKAGAGNKRR